MDARYHEPPHSMIAGAQRLAPPIRRRRDVLKQMLLLSLALHLALLLAFLIAPPAPPPHEASAPASVEIMADEGTAEGDKLPTPSYAPAIVAPNQAPATTPPPPPSAPTFAVPNDEIPTPPLPVPAPTESAAAPAAPAVPTEPAAPPPAPAPLAQAPPQPPPVPTPSAPAEVAELPPPPPPPPPVPAPPPRAPPAAARPPTPQPRTAARPAPRPAPLPFTMGSNGFVIPPQRAAPMPDRTSNNRGALDLSLGPEALNSAGAPPHSSRGVDASIRVEGADVGDDWIQQLHDWWDRHAFYPQEALVNGEDGVVQIHIMIQRDGRIDAVEVITSSGSRWLDMAGVSVWRNAHLRPFPSGTPQPRADIYVSLHYILLRGRG